jgi:hypothetical protein
MFRNTKLDENIPGGSSSESVPMSDEVDHRALIARATGLCGLVAVNGAPPNGAATVLPLNDLGVSGGNGQRAPSRGALRFIC